MVTDLVEFPPRVHPWVIIGDLLLPIVHTMDELKLSGNCLLGSRPLLSFDAVSGSICDI